MDWLYIEPGLTLWQNIRLRFWLLGMDFLDLLPRRWAWRPWLFCVSRAGRLSYGKPAEGPDGPPESWPF